MGSKKKLYQIFLYYVMFKQTHFKVIKEKTESKYQSKIQLNEIRLIISFTNKKQKNYKEILMTVVLDKLIDKLLEI